RSIEPVFAPVDTTDTNWSTAYQAACASFTQDHKVVAVLGYSFDYEEQFAQCLTEHRVLWFNSGYNPGDDVDYRRNPYYVTSIVPSTNAMDLMAVSSAVEDGWLTASTKLGIVRDDCPYTVRAYQTSVFPYLKAHHITVTDDSVASCGTGQQGAAD